MRNIIWTLIKSVCLLAGCFIVLIKIGLDRADSPIALRVAGVIAAVYFMVRSLSQPTASDRGTPRRTSVASVRTASGGTGVGVVTAAMTSMADDNDRSLFQDDLMSPLIDDSRSIFEDDNKHKFDTFEVNPANGLPMVGGTDVMGNVYGTDASSSFDSFDINPANGLPMVGGTDVMGNACGTDSSTSFDSFSNSHESFGNSTF